MSLYARLVAEKHEEARREWAIPGSDRIPPWRPRCVRRGNEVFLMEFSARRS